tara:strand:- start:862 stop:1536 length:675 start_codon:yes stop_codon:yes gene_type:complete
MQVLINMNLPQVTCVANVGGWKHGYVQNVIDWTGENWEEHPELGAKYLEKNLEELRGKKEEFQKAFDNGEVKYLFMFRNFYDSFGSRMKFIKEEYHNHQLLFMLQEWNNTNRHYLDKIQQYRDRSWFIRFEDLSSPKHKGYLLHQMVKHFKIPDVAKDWKDPGPRRLEPRAWNIETNTFKYLSDEEFQEPQMYQYNKDRTEEQMRLIKTHISRNLCNILGYEVL